MRRLLRSVKQSVKRSVKRSRSRCRSGQGGFTYVGLLILLALLALVGAGGVQLGAISRRHAAEQALLETGAAFSAALRSYARATPTGQPTAPKSLQDLLRDPRFPATVRHLRKVFIDPLTGSSDWGLVVDADGGGITAVYSLASGKPIKLAGFDSRFVDFDGKQSYRDWRFARPFESRDNPNGLGRGLISPGELAVDDAPRADRWTDGRTDGRAARPEPETDSGLTSPRGLR